MTSRAELAELVELTRASVHQQLSTPGLSLSDQRALRYLLTSYAKIITILREPPRW